MRIKELLKEKGMTQKELAEKMGITPPTLSVMLKNNMTMATLRKIARALDVDIISLYDTPEIGYKEMKDAPFGEQMKNVAYEWEREEIRNKFGSFEEYEKVLEEDRRLGQKITIICPHCGKEIPLKIDTEALSGKR